ncbi:MAG TPA: ArsR family transcriptional regulator [Gemmatimonadaceae bacterium]|jgi:predicted ArsR family transcriptional regulator
MTVAALGAKFLETTRGQMVALLRRGTRTVDDLASALGLTNNAIRNHLSTLERDGIVRQEGVRRGTGAGKPAVVYELHPDAEPLFSRAYVPVLRTLVDVLVDELPPEQASALLRDVGRRLAVGAGGRAAGDLEARTATAAALLTSLGGDVEVLHRDDGLRIRGCACPLSATVADHPQVCHAVEALISDVVGVQVVSTCEHGDRPRCCFQIARESASV